jgi:ribonuclease VapC
MIVGTSAVVAVLQEEPEAPRPASAANRFEAAIVLDSKGDAVARLRLDQFFRGFGIGVEAVTPELAAAARLACRAYGKGNHPARLNLGDSFACALATGRGEPLLFKGKNLARTDVTPALPATL